MLSDDVHQESDGHQQYAKSIELPREEIFRNLRNAKRFSIDIGGSLAKLVYLSNVQQSRTRHYSLSSSEREEEASSNQGPLYDVEELVEEHERLHFIKFETKYIEECLDFLQQNLLESGSELADKVIRATGGGAHKYKDLITSKLNVRVDKYDEMNSLINGCNFLIKHIPNEAFQFKRNAHNVHEYVFENLVGKDVFPYLLVNIGSGVSIIKVEGPEKYERIGGTSTGGGTFWGLGSLLTNAKGFDELLALAAQGSHKSVDMLVKDIYGGAYEQMNLPGELTASSFGKAVRASRDSASAEGNSESLFQPADVAKALLQMISNDIGQISSLYAQLHGLTRIIFGGYFIRGHPVTIYTISYAINYFSKGKIQALFLRHEGYLGAIGAFLLGAKDNAMSGKVSWGENYAASSEFPTGRPRCQTSYDVVEMDKLRHEYAACPLLADPDKYEPDLFDLGKDEAAREYWLKCFETGIDNFVKHALSSQSGRPDAKERAHNFRAKFLDRLSMLRERPYAFGRLSVRHLLDTREQFLDEFGFWDPYLQTKRKENECALQFFQAHLRHIDSLPPKQRELELITNLVTGNVFDWGAAAVQKLLADPTFGFADAQRTLQERPWLVDDLDKWLARLDGKPHELAVIFCDNSGVDIMLGILPFARDLLKRGSKVIVAANSYPAINDVIYSELVIIAERAAAMCPIISSALADGMLLLMETGTSSPCLDLRRLDSRLACAMKDADLVVLEGMGRSIHTNYAMKLTCECIKMAVLKNAWIAERFSGKLFDVVFKYESPNVT